MNSETFHFFSFLGSKPLAARPQDFRQKLGRVLWEGWPKLGIPPHKNVLLDHLTLKFHQVPPCAQRPHQFHCFSFLDISRQPKVIRNLRKNAFSCLFWPLLFMLDKVEIIETKQEERWGGRLESSDTLYLWHETGCNFLGENVREPKELLEFENKSRHEKLNRKAAEQFLRNSPGSKQRTKRWMIEGKIGEY